jgi:hypothetical protein
MALRWSKEGTKHVAITICDPTVHSGTDCTSYLRTVTLRWSKEGTKHVAITKYQQLYSIVVFLA